jgi:hypothetical protein
MPDAMEKLKFTLKDVIYILLIVSTFIANYTTTNNRIMDLEKDVTEIKQELKKNNLDLINYKLDEIMKLLNK